MKNQDSKANAPRNRFGDVIKSYMYRRCEGFDYKGPTDDA